MSRPLFVPAACLAEAPASACCTCLPARCCLARLHGELAGGRCGGCALQVCRPAWGLRGGAVRGLVLAGCRLADCRRPAPSPLATTPTPLRFLPWLPCSYVFQIFAQVGGQPPGSAEWLLCSRLLAMQPEPGPLARLLWQRPRRTRPTQGPHRTQSITCPPAAAGGAAARLPRARRLPRHLPAAADARLLGAQRQRARAGAAGAGLPGARGGGHCAARLPAGGWGRMGRGVGVGALDSHLSWRRPCSGWHGLLRWFR